MSTTVVALGELCLLEGYRLAGVRVLVADTDADVRRAWAAMATDTPAVVLLTPCAADVLGGARMAPLAPMTVVLPT